MLNPFAIEKDILTKVADIRQAAINIRTAFSQQILTANTQIDPNFRHQLRSYIAQSTTETKTYECKVCGKTFD